MQRNVVYSLDGVDCDVVDIQYTRHVARLWNEQLSKPVYQVADNGKKFATNTLSDNEVRQFTEDLLYVGQDATCFILFWHGTLYATWTNEHLFNNKADFLEPLDKVRKLEYAQRLTDQERKDAFQKFQPKKQ